jgi:hypothetical protein
MTENSILDLTKPDDNLRWALAALQLVQNRLSSEKRTDDGIALHNLTTAIGCITDARSLSANMPAPEVEPASLLADLERLGDAFADRVEQIAFSMKPPNPYTPQFVQAVQEFDAAVAKLKRLPPQNGST